MQVGRGPSRLYKYYIARRRERNAHACSLDIADEDSGLFILEIIDRTLAGILRGGTCNDTHAVVMEGVGQRLYDLGVPAKDHDVLFVL